MRLPRWSWLLLAAASCRPAGSGVVSPDADPCRIPGATTSRLDTITVAFSELENEAGRLLLRLSGATLIRVDCEGHTRPSLARSWTRDAAGTTWTFELDSTQTSDGVVAQWDLRRNGGLWPWDRILEARAPAPRRLEIRLDTAFASVPQAFAIPQLGVVPSRLADSVAMRVRILPSAADQRDLLDPPAGAPGADLMITRDQTVLNYAANKSGFSLTPLTWDRTYVVAGPDVVTRLGSDPAAFRQSLVREVIGADSRVTQGPYWWQTSPCAPTTPPLPLGSRPEIVYRQGDETAREIAERLVALQRPQLRAVGQPADIFLASLGRGEAVMYVLSLSRTAPGSCRQKPAWPSGITIIPLVDSRAHGIVRAGLPGFTIEGDGTFRFDEVIPLLSPSEPGQ